MSPRDHKAVARIQWEGVLEGHSEAVLGDDIAVS